MKVELLRRSAGVISVAALALLAGSLVKAGDLSDFKSPLDNSPMTFPLLPGEVETAAVKKFKATGDNDYRGNAEAIAAGKDLRRELYHLPWRRRQGQVGPYLGRQGRCI